MGYIGIMLPVTSEKRLREIKQLSKLFYGLPLVAQLVKNPPAMQETWVPSLVGKIPWRRERLPTPVFWPGKFHGLYSPWGHKETDMIFTH